MSHQQLSIDDIKMQLRARLPDLVRRGFPQAVLKMNRWEVVNHWRGERKGGSMFIYASGEKEGGWVDYGADMRGDVLDLAGYALEGTRDRKRCWAAALAFLGIDSHTPIDHVALAKERAADEARRAQMEADALEKLAKQRKRAMADWLRGSPIEDSPAEAYFASRGIYWQMLQRPARALRFLPAAEYWRDAKRGDDGRKISPGPMFPAIAAYMSGAEGKIAAVQYTFLEHSGAGKAPVEKPKLIHPNSAGAAIRLCLGVNACSPEQAARDGLIGETLVLCEGIEDGLTAALAVPEFRVWATCGINNLGFQHVPPSVSTIIILADNDWAKPSAAAALEKNVSMLRDKVDEVRIARSQVGKDFNDWLQS